MMNLDTFDLTVLGSILISWLAVATAVFCLYKVHHQSKLTKKLYERLSRELKVVNNSSMGVGRRLLTIEQMVQSGGKGRNARPVDKDEAHLYFQAQQLLASGVDIEQVVRHCGLSQAEIALMEKIHRPSEHASMP